MGCLGLVVLFCGFTGLVGIFGDVDTEPNTDLEVANLVASDEDSAESTLEPTKIASTDTSIPTDTLTPVGTDTVEPTEDAPEPTDTVRPSDTRTPLPTDTTAPQATNTPRPAAIQSTNTPIPSTNTPRPATNTLIPPTNTLPPPTNTLPPPTPTFDAAGQCSADIYNCGDFSSQPASQAMFDSCQAAGYGDAHRLDFNNNNIACEMPDETQEEIFYNPPTATPRPIPTATPVPIQPTVVPLPTNTTAPATSSVKIIAVDKRTEVVTIRNDGGVAQDLNGWTLRSERGNQDCPLYGSIQAGQTIQIWAESKNADKGGINCGFNTTIWNNSDRDNAVLLNSVGQEVSRFNS